MVDALPELLFAAWAVRFEGGEALDFDDLIRAHPGQVEELRRLYDDWRLFAPLLGKVVPGLLANRSGIVVAPLSGEDEDAVEMRSSELLDRLRIQVPNSSRYRFRAVIGRGGGGVVLKVWDTKLNRPLAMKVVLGRSEERLTSDTPMVDGRALARFVDEARIASQLNHPGIVPVHELGADDAGRAFFTMKLVKGEDLSLVFDHVKTGHDGWNRTRALGVLLRVCEAMAYAHAKQVIHRDLKPSNVMVGPYGEVYVMDWGLARVVGEKDPHDLRIRPLPRIPTRRIDSVRHPDGDASPHSPLMTMEGTVVGTPAYMSPEQAKGDLEQVGIPSDVYSIGAMLYELSAGRPPFVHAGERPAPQVVWMRVTAGPPEPLHALAPRAPAELVAICERAMARDANQRYRDMRELAEDLRAFLERRVVHAYEAGAWAETKKWLQRNKPLAAALAAVVLALAGGLLASLSLKQEANANALLASQKEGIATQRANDILSLSAIQDLAELVARADQLWPAQPETIPAYEQWLKDAQLMIEGRPADPQHGIKARPSLAQLQAKLIELRSRARPQTDEERKVELETHPRLLELTAKKAELTWLSRMLGLEPWPSKSEVESALAKETLPSEGKALNTLAWEQVSRDARPVYGREVWAYLIARRAVATASAPEDAIYRDTVAWALYELGQLDDALSEDKRAVAEIGVARRAEFERNLAKLTTAIDRWRGESALSERRKEREVLAREVEALEREVSERRTWEFADIDDRWWHAQLSKLVTDLESLRNPETGLYSEGLSADHGWGVRRRYEFARSIEERSLRGAEASKRWSEAIDAIARSANYDGLQLRPQLGLLPIGPDRQSGLWEFAHLQTGEPAERGADGKLKLTEETGLVFVLLPAGSYFMGAQRTDPHAHNFDPNAQLAETPVLEVTLDAFFLSKYEMTQGQWMRMEGRNPSFFGLRNYVSEYNRENRPWTALHPVEQVSWTDCTNLMRRMSLSLPTEAQWEYGCRARTSSVYWSGDEAETLREVGNVVDAYSIASGCNVFGPLVGALDDGNTVHAEVGSFRANAYGLHDMHGNVQEWTGDQMAKYSRPTLPGDGGRMGSDNDMRVIRGGGWSDGALIARSATRDSYPSQFRNTNLGLRPARAITP